jgi:hypothetical protein
MEHFVRKGFTHGLAYLADVLPKWRSQIFSIENLQVTIMVATEELQFFFD